MKRLIIIIVIIFIGIFLIMKFLPEFNAGSNETQDELVDEPFLPVSQIQLQSPVFQDGGAIPKKYTCDGDDVNPSLVISHVPEKARNLILIVDDPDAPAGDWVHWVVFNITADTASIDENSVPYGAIQGMNDFGKREWGGPCPPSGTHRYQFKLYATENWLDLGPEATKADVEEALKGAKVLAQTMLTGMYKR